MFGHKNAAGNVDWAALRAAAVDISHRAYAPYSHFRVGAAGIADDGRLLTGCNVENAGYGVALCAECGLISSLVASGGGRLRAFVCVGAHDDIDDPPVVMPCGRCRQILWEHGGADMLIETPEGVQTMAQVLPQAFGPEALD